MAVAPERPRAGTVEHQGVEEGFGGAAARRRPAPDIASATEQAGPFVAVAEMGGDAGGVNENDQRKNMSAKRMAEKRARILVAMLRPAAMRARPVR